MNLSLIRTDHVQRFHVYVDTEAAKLTAFRIELFPHPPTLVGNADMTQDDLWREAMATLQWLRIAKDMRDARGNPLRGGVMKVPPIMDLDAWEAIAALMQDALIAAAGEDRGARTQDAGTD